MVDYSSALPWLLSGVIAGVLLYALIRALLGIDRKRIAALEQTYAALDEERRVSSETASRAAMLDAERSRLTTELNQAAPRAALVPQLERQLSELRHAESARQTQFDEAERELSQLRADTETSARTAKYYEDEFARLFADHESTSKAAKFASDELLRTKQGLEVATREASEAATLRGEVAKLRGALEAAQREASDAVRLRSELASAKASLDAAAADAQELTRVRADFADFRTKADTLGKDADEAARLRAELKTAHNDLANFRGDIERLSAESAKNADLLAKVTADYEGKLKSAIAEIATRTAEQRKASEDIAALKSQIASTPSVVDRTADLANLRAELGAANQSLASVRNALEDTTILAAARHDEIERLKSQLSGLPAELENYRRFKDALDAANRIAAGLPDKA